MALPEDEDPIEGPEKGKQEIANERLAEGARRTSFGVDHSYPEVSLREALSVAQAIGEEEVGEVPHDAYRKRHSAERSSERIAEPHDRRRGEKRDRSDDAVDELPEEAVGARNNRYLISKLRLE